MKIFSILFVTILLNFSAYSRHIVIVTLNSPPMEFKENNQPTGFNIEIAKEALKRLGHSCEIRLVPWKRALIQTKNGLADAILDAGFNDERAAYLDYPSENIYTEYVYGFKLKTSKVVFQKDISNAGQISIGIGRGFHYGDIIQNAIDNEKFKDVQEANNVVMNIKKLLSGRFDVFIGVKEYTLYELKRMNKGHLVEMVHMVGTTEPYQLSASKTYLAFSKKKQLRDLADKIGIVLRELKRDGTYNKVYAKYR